MQMMIVGKINQTQVNLSKAAKSLFLSGECKLNLKEGLGKMVRLIGQVVALMLVRNCNTN